MSAYLSKLTLDARDADTRRWLADCNALHRAIMSGFPDVEPTAARAELRVLFRVEASNTQVSVLVQSGHAPNWQFESRAVVRVDGPKDIAALMDNVRTGSRYRFRLRANPTRRVHARSAEGPDAREKPGAIAKRVPLLREEDRMQWLARRGREHDGFELVHAAVEPSGLSIAAARADPAGRLLGYPPKTDHRLTFESALFEGALEVTDADVFRAAVSLGIGPGKAFGCGLLSFGAI